MTPIVQRTAALKLIGRIAMGALILLGLGQLVGPYVGIAWPFVFWLAAPLALFTLFVFPGLLLDSVLHLSGERCNPSSPALWFLLSAAAMAPAGWLVLELHTRLSLFGLLAAGIDLALLVLWLVRERGRRRPWDWEMPCRQRPVWLAAGLLFLVAAGLTMAAPRSSDDWAYGSYLRDYVDSPALNREDPAYGKGLLPIPRMEYDTWLVQQAFFSQASGMEPVFQAIDWLEPLLILFFFSAWYALGRQMFRPGLQAFVVMAFSVLVWVLTPQFGQPGYGVLVAITHDKRVAMYIVQPLMQALLLRYLSTGERRVLLGVFLGAVGLAGVHAEFYLFMLITWGCIFVSLLLFRRHKQEVWRLIKAVLVVSPLLVVPLLIAFGHGQVGPSPGGPGWDVLQRAEQSTNLFIYLGNSPLFLIDPSDLLHPLWLLSLAGAIFLGWRYGRKNASPNMALLFGVQIGLPLLMVVPGLPNLLYMIGIGHQVRRLIWLMLPGVVWAGAAIYAKGFLRKVWRSGLEWHARQRVQRRMVWYALAGLVGLACLAALAWIPAKPMFVDKLHPNSLLLPSAGLHETLRTLAASVDQMDQPTVLANPVETFQVPASLGNAHVLVMRGVRGTLTHFPADRQTEALEGMALVDSLAGAPALDELFLQRLRSQRVDLLVLNNITNAAWIAMVEQYPLLFPRAFQSASHSVYLVNVRGENAARAVGEAQIRLAAGDWAGGCALLEQALAHYPDSPAALVGAGLCRVQAGQKPIGEALLQQARALLTNGGQSIDMPEALAIWTSRTPWIGSSWVARQRAGLLALTYNWLSEPMVVEWPATMGLAWVGGWPRRAAHVPAGSAAWITAGQPGQAIWTWLVPQQPNGLPVYATLLGETADGWRTYAMPVIASGDSWLAELTLPAAGLGRLLIGAATVDGIGGLSVLTPLSREDVAPAELSIDSDAQTVQLADWLKDTLYTALGRIVDTSQALYAARLLLEEAPASGEIGQTAALPYNVVQNPTFGQGLAGWTPVTMAQTIQFRVETLPDSLPPDAVGVIQSTGEGYQGGLCQTVSVQPGRPYLYLFRTRGQFPAGAFAALGHWDYQRLRRLYTSEWYKLAGDWVWTAHYGVVTPGWKVRQITLCPVLMNNTGSVLLDQVWLLPLDALP